MIRARAVSELLVNGAHLVLAMPNARDGTAIGDTFAQLQVAIADDADVTADAKCTAGASGCCGVRNTEGSLTARPFPRPRSQRRPNVAPC